MSFDNSVWKDQKTLIWLHEAPDSMVHLERWDSGAPSVAVATAMRQGGSDPDIVLCFGAVEACAAWCKEGHAARSKIVVVTRELVQHMGVEKFAELGLGNVVCIEEVHEMYPFVGGAWDGSVEDAKLMIAMLFHFARTFPAENPSGRELRGLRIQSRTEIPQRLWFVTQYYKAQSPSRRAEIDTCLEMNTACDVIDKIVLLNETACAKPHPKIEETVIGKRLTYADVFRWIYEKAPPNILVAFANADIFLDATSWRELWSTDIQTVPKLLALLRWDVTSATPAGIAAAKLFGPRADSQDTWVISSTAVKAVTWDWAALDFPFGQGGCDNAITIEVFKKKFLVANPALTLKTYHLHGSGIRSYDPRNVVEKPVFLYIQPTGLHDLKPVKDIPTTRMVVRAPVERRIRGPLTEAQARTFCTMIARSTDDAVSFSPDGANLWSPKPVPISQYNDVFYTRDGLAYTYNTILVGNTKASADAWAASKVSYLAASMLVKDALIAPLPDAVAGNPGRYILEYMSKVFLLQELFETRSAEFWCSRKPECGEALRMFAWPSPEIPVISRDENQQTWCSSGTIWPYQDDVPQHVSREEIGALRKMLGLGGWIPTSEEKQLVIVVDNKWITEECVEAIEQGSKVKVLWAGRTSLEASLRSMRGASGIVLSSGCDLAAWVWVLPCGAHVWEVQSEMEPSATLLHTSSVAQLEHRLMIVPKGTPTAKDVAAMTAKLFASLHEEEPKPPRLLLPSGHTGFFAHAGDSFREIAEEWGRRGYVTCEKSSVHNIWLNGVGDTLLYDRPTKEWLIKSPKQELTWKRALFGNPAPHGERGKSWSFWPRRPLLVEELVEQGIPLKSWEARTKTLVFYGRSENSVQKGHRTRANWSSICDDFVHSEGSNPYPYSQKEYLELLSNACFGLCLAGYGFKCHREIECMAMGCIPIAGPDVDMMHYAEPPVEGLHYLRVTDPENARAALEKITPERWMVMSVACRDWWKRNCSVEGMWKLTQRIMQEQVPPP